MRKLVLAVIGVFMVAGIAMADDTTLASLLTKIPVTNGGIFYNINDHSFKQAYTFELADYKGVSLNAGYTDPDSALVAVGYDIVKLQKFGINMPIVKDIILNAGFGMSWKQPFNKNELGYGPEINLKLKW